MAPPTLLPTSRWAAVLVCGAVALTACGSDAPPVATVPVSPPGGSIDSASIEASLGFGLREFGLTDQAWTVAVDNVQSSIASCMADAGFEYIPADVDTVELAMSAVRTEPGVSREEYKQQWGFGVTTRFDNRPKEIELGEQNLGVIASLSAADKVAYERTLYGEDPDATFAFHFDEEEFEPTGGCTLAAVEASFDPAVFDPNFSNPKDVLIESDGRVAAADVAWADCMGAAGHDYEDQDDIIAEYDDRLDELLDGDDVEDLTGARADALAALQREEIVVSLVDLDCQIAHVDDVIRDAEIELFGKVVSFG